MNKTIQEKLLEYSDRYEISIQYWPEQTAVYISKDSVDLTDFGGNTTDRDLIFIMALNYLEKINGDARTFVNPSRPA